jgi:DNA polymerase-4
MEKSNSFGKTLVLKVKFHDFRQITRSKTFNQEISDYQILWKLSQDIFNKLNFENQKIRLMGLSVSNLPVEVNANTPLQLTINF